MTLIWNQNGPIQVRFQLRTSLILTLHLDRFSDGSDLSSETIEKGRNKFYQQQLAIQLTQQITEMTSLLTSALHIHLNIGQNLSMDTSAMFMSLETLSIESLSNKRIGQVGNAKIRLPTLDFQTNRRISLRVRCISLMIFR